MKHYFTTSSQIKSIEHLKSLNGVMGWKQLNPDIDGWKPGDLLTIRLHSGIDIIVEWEGDIKKREKNIWSCRFKILKTLKQDNSKKRAISKKLKDLVIEKQNNKCKICNDIFTEENRADFDHRIEWSYGGLTTLSNIDALCTFGCHHLKTLFFEKDKRNIWLKELNSEDIIHIHHSGSKTIIERNNSMKKLIDFSKKFHFHYHK